jgi:hypothetical protein
MKKLMAAFTLYLTLFTPTAKAQSIALTIYDVTVYTNDIAFNAPLVGWHFPVTLQPGETLVLAQNGNPCGVQGYCFDTSDYGPQWAWVVITTSAGTFGFLDGSRILTTEGGNESRPVVPRFNTTAFEVGLGYADTAHPCGVTPCLVPPIGTYTQAAPSDLNDWDTGVVVITAH